jgi:tRNA (uracil-5-)-methyltransferase
MNCEYFGTCGSCTLGNMSYEEQLDFKIQREKTRFADLWNNDIEIIKSDDGAFRNRAEFRIFHDRDKLNFAMSSIDKKLMTINNCSIVSLEIAKLMPIILNEIKNNEILSHKFFSIEFLTSTIGDILVTMIYHKKLDESWNTEAIKLQNKLSIKIIGRSRGQKVVLSMML